jgi:pyrophosphatase PpaX
MPTINTVLFDLDGTLIDSIGLILSSYRHTMTAHGFPDVADDEWLRGVGTPLRAQLGPWARDDAHLEALVATYRDYNLSNHDTMVRPFPHVSELVREIRERGFRTGVVTSKTREGTRRGLKLVGLEDAIEIMVCADDVTNAKPHPEPVNRAVAALSADPRSTIFVGDSIHDLHSGRDAGVLTGAVLWGPFARSALEPAAPDYWLDTPEHLGRLILR